MTGWEAAALHPGQQLLQRMPADVGSVCTEEHAVCAAQGTAEHACWTQS